jgi:hypothetical protein
LAGGQHNRISLPSVPVSGALNFCNGNPRAINGSSSKLPKRHRRQAAWGSHNRRAHAGADRKARATPGVGDACGFPSPADDHLDRPLDFNKLLVQNPAATFAVRIAGESMTGAGLFPGDIAVVDRSLTPANGCIVLALIDGEFTIKRYQISGGGVVLTTASLQVFVHTNRFRIEDAQHFATQSVQLPVATADTGRLTSAALRGVAAIWKQGDRYKGYAPSSHSDSKVNDLKSLSYFPSLTQWPWGPSRESGDHNDWDRIRRVCCRLGIHGWNGRCVWLGRGLTSIPEFRADGDQLA